MIGTRDDSVYLDLCDVRMKPRPNHRIYLQILRRMTPDERLPHVITALEQTGIDYMVAGSIASSLQGEPRARHDVDAVIVVREQNVSVLVGEAESLDDDGPGG